MMYKIFLNTLLFIGFSYPVLSQERSADLFSKWKIALAKKNYRNDTANVILLNSLSHSYLYNNADSALYFAKQALPLARQQHFLHGEAVSLGSISSAYYVKGDYRLSLDASESLLNASKKLNFLTGIANAYKIMGLIYMDQQKFDEAISDLQTSLKLCTRLKDSSQMNKAYFNIGLAFDEMGRPEKAFYYLDKSMAIAKKRADSDMISMTLNRTGETYFILKNYKTALAYYQAVLNAKNSDNWELDFAFSGIAQTYEKLGNYKKAIFYAQKSLAFCEKVNSKYDAVRVLAILTRSYAVVKDYRNAYRYETALKKTDNSLFNIAKDKEINYLHLKQQEAENKQLENDIRAKEQIIAANSRLIIFRNLLAISAVFAALIIFWSYRRSLALNKQLKRQNDDIARQKEEISIQNEMLDGLNKTKNQLFAIISHDLRSPFSAMLQTIDLMRSGDISGEEQVILFDGFYQQVALVNLMVNNLLAWSNSQQNGISSNPVLFNITNVVKEVITLSAFFATNKKINLDQQCDGDKWIFADIDHVKIIFQNLIGNAIKFTPVGGTIAIYCADDNGYYALHIKDNGLGIPPEKMEKLFKVTGKEISGYGTKNESGAGIGLALVKQFIDINAGRIEVSSIPGDGTDFTVYFKKQVVTTS